MVVVIMGMRMAMPVIMRQVQGVGGVVRDVVVDLAEGGAALLGCDAAVLVFREDLGLAVGQLRDLHADASVGGVHCFDPAGQGIALHGGVADAERGTLVEEEVLELGAAGGLAEDLEKDAGPPLLHLGREHTHVEGTGFHEELGDVADQLGGFVVEVGLEEAERFGDQSRRGGGGCAAGGLRHGAPHDVHQWRHPGRRANPDPGRQRRWLIAATGRHGVRVSAIMRPGFS